MLKFYRKFVAAFKHNRRNPKEWVEEQTWVLCFIGGGASLVAAFYGFVVAEFGPDLVRATNGLPFDQWASASGLIVMLSLGGCAVLAWYHFQLAQKPLKALSDRLFKD